MNYKKFFELAKSNNINESEFRYRKESSLSFSLFKHELTNYTTSIQSSIVGRGIYNNRMGFSITEDLSNKGIEFLIKGIKDTAQIMSSKEEPIIFKGSDKYHKHNLFNKELTAVPIEKKLELLRVLEDEAYALDKRVSKVVVEFEESEEESLYTNSYGLYLKNKENYFVYSIEVVANQNEETKSSFEIYLGDDFTKFNPKELAKKAVDKVLKKFNGVSIKNKLYKAILSDKVVSTFVGTLVSFCNAEDIQYKSSLFVDKLNTQVVSKKLTIEEKPLTKNFFFTYFDGEGVACYNKKIIDKGILKTYLYNLQTAKKDGVPTTANAVMAGSKSSIGTVNLFVKPGKLSEDQLFEKIKNGVYITSVSGLHAGLNKQSGDFSLEAEGFVVENGKISSPLKLITIGGNILKLFKDIIALGSNNELHLSSTTCPSMAIKNLNVSSL